MTRILINTIFILYSCNPILAQIRVKTDTLAINIRGNSGPAIKVGNIYYLYYKTDNSYFSSPSNTFYALNQSTQKSEKIFVPDDLQETYLDLYTRNDSIFTTEYWKQTTFFLKSSEWKKTEKIEDIIYEDGDYSISSLDYGEFGGCTWFKNKKSKIQYELGTTTPIVNRIKNIYYLTTNEAIYRIDDPTALKKSDSPYLFNRKDYQKKVKNPSNSFQGAKAIFKNQIIGYDYKYSLGSSFIIDEKLVHIFSDSLGTYIGTLENETMKTLYQFKDRIKVHRWHYHNRYRTNPQEKQSIQFTTLNNKMTGVIEIDGRNIHMTYFKNTYKESILGTEKANVEFKKAFEFYFSQFKNLKLETVESIEKDLSATDLTQRHKMSTIYTSENVETPRIYRKIEDSTFVIHTLYYYTKNDSSIHSICFDWKQNNLNKDFPENFDIKASIDERDQKLFESRLVTIKEYLTDLLGIPDKDILGPNYTETTWEKNGKKINLHSNELSIELNLYI